MPGGNGTGPMGMGPMTGRGAGYCAGFAMPGYMNPGTVRGCGPGRGLGLGRGFGPGAGRGAGRGFGRGFGFAAAVPETELSLLKHQLERLEQATAEIRRRMADLNSPGTQQK